MYYHSLTRMQIFGFALCLTAVFPFLAWTLPSDRPYLNATFNPHSHERRHNTNPYNNTCANEDYEPLAGDWDKWGTDGYLTVEYFDGDLGEGEGIPGSHSQKDMREMEGGFAQLIGNRTLGKPQWSCQLDGGEGSNCGFDECDIAAPGRTQMEQIYMILHSMKNMQAFFKGTIDAFTQASVGTALVKDKWAEQFNPPQAKNDNLELKALFSGLAAIAGATAAFGGLGGPVAGGIAGTGASILSFGLNMIVPLIEHR